MTWNMRARRWTRTTAALGLFVSLTAGCQCGAEGRDAVSQNAPSSADEGAPAEMPTVPVGTIEGVVYLTEGPLPESPLLRQERPKACPVPKLGDREVLHLGQSTPGQGHEQGLAGVLVALSDFSDLPKPAPVKHQLSIVNCVLRPALVSATVGDSLVLTNESDFPFMPVLPSSGPQQALLEAQSAEVSLVNPGVMPVTCGFSGACGQTDVFVLRHGLHAVSRPGGTFRIEGVPVGDKVRVNAWHPQLKETGLTVRVAEGEVTHVELGLAPAATTAPEPLPSGKVPVLE